MGNSPIQLREARGPGKRMTVIGPWCGVLDGSPMNYNVCSLRLLLEYPDLGFCLVLLKLAESFWDILKEESCTGGGLHWIRPCGAGQEIQ